MIVNKHIVNIKNNSIIIIILKFCLTLILIIQLLSGQNYIAADPFSILIIERENFLKYNYKQSLVIRPLYNISNRGEVLYRFRNEVFINDNYPNLENMDNRWVGKGIGFFSGVNVSYSNKFLNFSIEPYYYFNQNSCIQ